MAYGNCPSRASLAKQEIVRDAAQFCDASFDMPIARTRNYTAWNGMKTLLDKDYVYKNGSPARYKLTESGLLVASQLVETAKKQGKDLGALTGKEITVTTVRISVGGDSETGNTTRDVLSVNDSDHCAGSLAISPISTPSRTIFGSPISSRVSLNNSLGGLHRSLLPNYASNLNANSKPSISLPTVDPIVWQPGTFELNIILDTREIRHKQDRTYIQEKLEERGISVSVRSLELGDVIWVARRKDSNSSVHDDIVLDYIVERKRMDDLVSSIKDGRFKEQKVSTILAAGKFELNNDNIN
jgi:crossover junction endonuclease MUS81